MLQYNYQYRKHVATLYRVKRKMQNYRKLSKNGAAKRWQKLCHFKTDLRFFHRCKENILVYLLVLRPLIQ